MNEELENYRRQFEAIKPDAQRLLDGLVDAQLVWRPSVESWSITDCLNHLVVTGRESLSRIRTAIVAARSRMLFSSGSFRHGMPGNLLIKLMDAPPKLKFKAPRAYGQSLDCLRPK